MRDRPITAIEQDIINRLPEPWRLPPTPQFAPTVCAWTKDEDGIWTAACHKAAGTSPSFCFEDGGPTDNRFRFCPYCGSLIAEG